VSVDSIRLDSTPTPTRAQNSRRADRAAPESGIESPRDRYGRPSRRTAFSTPTRYTGADRKTAEKGLWTVAPAPRASEDTRDRTAQRRMMPRTARFSCDTVESGLQQLRRSHQASISRDAYQVDGVDERVARLASSVIGTARVPSPSRLMEADWQLDTVCSSVCSVFIAVHNDRHSSYFRPLYYLSD